MVFLQKLCFCFKNFNFVHTVFFECLFGRFKHGKSLHTEVELELELELRTRCTHSMCRVLVLKTWGAEASIDMDLIHLSIVLLSYRTVYVQRCTTPVNMVIEIIALKDKFFTDIGW